MRIAIASLLWPMVLPLVAETMLRMGVNGGHATVAQVFIDGRGPFRFLVDTGAESSSLEPRLAARLGLVADSAVEMVTPTGVLLVPAAAAVPVRVADLTFAPAEMVVHAVPLGLDGILGRNVLSQVPFLMDFDRQVLSLAPGGAPSGGVPLSAAWTIPVRLDGRRYELTLDSGATHVVLFRNPPALSGQATLETASGRQTVDIGVAAGLEAGTLRVDRFLFAYAPQVRESDGLLPLALAGSVYIDARGGIAVLGTGLPRWKNRAERVAPRGSE